jgi:HPr kinase/phosphorylase
LRISKLDASGGIMYTLSLDQIVSEFRLEPVNQIKDSETISVCSTDVNRPGLQLTQFYDFFDSDRLQIIGKVETSYLSGLTSEVRKSRLDGYFKLGFPALIVARNMEVFPEMIEVANHYNIPLYRTQSTTSRFLSELIKYLNLNLSPRITKHGVFVEVYGEGVLILGESGVGKSETALELVKRGHRLVTDDVVEIRKVSETTLIGTAPDIIRHFIEIRGIGILDVKNLFGMGSVKVTESISLVINLELWNNEKSYERLGLENEYEPILGIQVPSLIIPVRPGRNLAIIVEVAAMNNRQKKMGYNAAKVLNERILDEMEKEDQA